MTKREKKRIQKGRKKVLPLFFLGKLVISVFQRNKDITWLSTRLHLIYVVILFSNTTLIIGHQGVESRKRVQIFPRLAWRTTGPNLK